VFSVEHVNQIRLAEINAIAAMFPPRSRILEVGAGTGQQALRLVELGHVVDAIDLPDGTYAAELVYPVRAYDGRSFPFESDSFDVVYSSNLLEHVKDLGALHREIRRVLVPDGSVIHVLPTHSWRFWTTLSSIIALHVPWRHGERGTMVSELWTYHPRWWRRHFRSHDFGVAQDQPVGYFYSGTMLLGSRLSMSRRASLAKSLGSATWVYRLSLR
jgi:SAM-dependent methyltransferase